MRTPPTSECRAARPDLPQPFITIIETLPATDSGHRYPTAAAVETALGRCVVEPTAVEPRNPLRYAKAVGLAAVLLTAVNLWVRANAHLARLYRRNGQEDKSRAVETNLLQLLAAADADHPLLVELDRRR